MTSPHHLSASRSLWDRLTVLDRITLSYIAVFGLGILLLGRDRPGWQWLAVTHVLLILIVGLVIRHWDTCETGVRGILRQLYPVILYTFFYAETQVAIHWVFPEFLDAQLVAFEKSVFGVDPNLWIIPAQKAAFNEWMMMGYFSYYLMVPVVAFSLFFQRRIREVNAFLTATTITFVISYVGFVVFPIEGPRFFLADQLGPPLNGFVFVTLVRWIIDGAAVHGGCMPSSHVAVSWVVLIWVFRTQKRLAYVLTPLVITLTAATVWGRFHYVTDVFVGGAVGLLGLWIANKLLGDKTRKDAISMEDGRLRSVPPVKSLGGVG